MKKINIFFIAFIVSVFSIKAQQITQNFTYSQNNLEFNQIDGYDYPNYPDLHGLFKEELAGKPQIPVQYCKLLLPQGAKPTNVSLQILSEEQVSGTHYLYPIQPPTYSNGEDPPAFVEPDLTIYNSNTPFPSDYIVNYHTSVYRDYTYISIGFRSFRYIPLDRILHLLTNVKITVDYTITPYSEVHKLRDYSDVDEMAYGIIEQSMTNGTQIANIYPNMATKKSQYQSKSINTIIGKAFTPTDLPAIEGSPVHYVIITNNSKINGESLGDFISKFQDFADWKTQSGIPAKVVTVDEIRENYSGVDVQEKIREFIKDAHQNWGTEYVLLGGMSSIIPTRWIPGTNEEHTDLYYSAIYDGSYNDNWNADGDTVFGETGDECNFTPDIVLGRAPVDTLDEVNLFLKKNFTYTRCSFASDYGASIPDGAWLNKQLNIATGLYYTSDYIWDNDHCGMYATWHTTENYSHTTSNTSGSNEQYTMHVDYEWKETNPSWCPAYYPFDDDNGTGCSTSGINIINEYIKHNSVIDQLNNRYGIIHHMDHSGPWGLGLKNGNGSLRANDFQSLNSTNKYSVFLAGGCETAPLQMGFFIGEQWLNAPNGGVSFLGASILIWLDDGNEYSLEFNKSLYEYNKHIIGHTNNFTAINCSDDSYLHKIYQLLGDPALSIYTDAPTILNVTYNNSIENGNHPDYIVNVTNIPANENATVCLYKEGEVLAYQTVNNSNPDAHFNITPDTTGEMKLTVTCHNTEPFESSVANPISITQKPEAHLYVSNVALIGDANGIVEPNEEVTIRLTITNSGGSVASASNASLSATNANITSANPVNYSSINSGTSIDLDFTFKADSTGNIIPFSLDLQNELYIEEFFLNIISPQLELGDRIANESGDDEEADSFEKYKDYDLYIRVNNFGEVGTNVTSVLTTTSNHIQINANSYNYEEIDALTDKVNSTPFTFYTESTYTNNSPIPLKLTLTDSNGIIKQISFVLLSETIPKVSSFDFSSSNNHILLDWEKPSDIELEDMKGYNIYRDIDESGDFTEKINTKIISSAPMFYDDNVIEESEYYYKISVVTDTGDEHPKGDLNIFKAWTSIKRHASFPVKADVQAGLVATTSPTVFDVDGSGTKEIFLNYRNSYSSIRGRIMGFKHTGEELFNIDGTDEVWGFADVPQDMVSKSAIGDVDNDGFADLFSAGQGGDYYGYKTTDGDGDDKPDPLWVSGHISTGNYIFKNPVLADINNDGFLNSIIANHNQKLVVYDNNNKQILWSTQIVGGNPSSGELAVADLNGDNLKDIVIGFRDVESSEATIVGGIYVFWNTSTASQVSFSPSLIKEFPNEKGDGTIVLADINNDGKVDILTTTKEGSFKSHFYVLDYNGDILDGNPNWNDLVDYGKYLNISVGDLNNDNQLEIVLSSTSGFKSLVLLDNQGNTIFYKNKILQNPAILADIDNNPDYIEIIINYKGVLYAYKPDVNGTECENWRLQSDNGSKFVGSPFIGDIDGDNKNEVVISTVECETYVWETEGDADKTAWGSQRYDAQNTAAIIPPCMVTGNPVEVSNTTTWNSVSNYYQGDLVINENVILTVNSGTLSFAQGSKLVINKGAKLILGDGTQSVTLNSECGTYWQGIRVKGDATESQDPETNQGVLKINANVTIQDAEIAIYVGGEEAKMNKGEDLSGDETWNAKAGGIIKIDGVEFINNISGIEMPHYRDGNLPNESYIRNSIFKTSTDYNHPKTPDAFISLWDLGSIEINGNEFINENDFEFDERGVCINQGRGIDTSSAEVNISQNTFTKLFTGIKIGHTALGDVIIDNNQFNNNISGVLLKVADNVTVTSNIFDVSNTFDFTNSHYKPSGLYIHESNAFHIENNNFSAIGDITNETIGVYVTDCRAYNEIYKNIFNDLYIGVFSYGQNIDANLEGLNFICNSFQYIQLHEVYVDQDSFIDAYQGSIDLAAGNEFTPIGTGTPDDLAINSRMILNYYHRDVTAPSTFIPVNNCKCLVNIPSDNPNTCDSKLDKFVSDVKITNKDSEINQSYAQLQAITDGGDTEALTETVEEANNSEALQLRNELLSKSPTLSDTIMVNTTSIEDVLPALMVKQVLAANPKAAKSQKVQNALDDRQNQLPEYMREEIDLGRNTLSYKETLESKLAQIIHEKEDLINKRIIQLKREANVESLDSLKTLLTIEASNKLNRTYQLVKYHVSKGENQEAQTVFNAVPTNFDLSSSQQNRYDKLNQLYSIRFNLENANKTWFEMDSIQKQTIYTLAIDSTSTAGIQARGIISLVDHIAYSLFIPDIEGSNKQSNSYDGPPKMIFTATPEVATDYFIIEYVLGENENPEEVTIEVFDNKGNQLKHFEIKTRANQFLIECENWKEGVYWCRKSVDKKVTEQQKVIINKGGIVIDSVEASSVKGTNSLVLFPNPTSGYLFVSFMTENNTKTNIQITNTKGILIAKYQLKNNLTQIATDKWQQGVYIVNIIANNKIVDTAKIIVE